jgi:general secretion pathway protein I
LSVSRPRGFTLIEVLVALAIVAIGMAAVLEALTSSANTAAFLQSKTFAQWAALNRLETVRLLGADPPVGTSHHTVEYAGRKWEWQQKVTDTQIPGLLKIEVNVRPAASKAGADRGWYAGVTGFMSNAIDPGTTPEQTLFQWSPNNPINGPAMAGPGVPTP